jgi:hypothetical protein
MSVSSSRCTSTSGELTSEGFERPPALDSGRGCFISKSAEKVGDSVIVEVA